MHSYSNFNKEKQDGSLMHQNLICISNSENQTKHFLSIINPIPTNSLQSSKPILLQELTHFPKNIEEVFPDAQNFYSLFL